MSLKVGLPPAKSSTSSRTFYDHSDDPWFKKLLETETTSLSSSSSSCRVTVVKAVPAYLKRQGFRPIEFGDGGAFPEIHVPQYPLGLGKHKSSTTLPVTLDVQGNAVFDALVRQNNKIVYSQHKDLIPKILKTDGDDLDEEELEKEQKIQDTAKETKAAIDKIMNVSCKNVKSGGSSRYIKYKPSEQCADFKERMVRMVDMAVDPLDPPKFKHKRVPRACSDSTPVPVMHSPPRPVSVKDKQDWNIPPCISNWKNAKGYTIPLDKRLAADGRGLQVVQVNDDFAKLSEALFVAEHKAREGVSMRSKIHKEMVIKDKERREEELSALARKARAEVTTVTIGGHVREREERDKIREERKRERRLEAAGVVKTKTKTSRDRERDITEKVALGMASTGGRGGEVMYDQRLFNQEKGMDSGFATDDQYNVYDKGLFAAQSTLSKLCKPNKDTDDEMYGNNADEQVHKLKNATERFKPDKAFGGGGCGGAGKRERPVDFTEEVEEDPFGLAQWASDLKKPKKPFRSGGGTMGASGGGGSTSTDHYGRTKINFQPGPSSLIQ